MASFVEQATLLVKDQSSAKIKKINKELKQLFDLSKKLKNTKIRIDVSETGVDALIRDLMRIDRLASKRHVVDVRASVTGEKELRAGLKNLDRTIGGVSA